VRGGSTGFMWGGVAGLTVCPAPYYGLQHQNRSTCLTEDGPALSSQCLQLSCLDACAVIDVECFMTRPAPSRATHPKGTARPLVVGREMSALALLCSGPLLDRDLRWGQAVLPERPAAWSVCLRPACEQVRRLESTCLC